MWSGGEYSLNTQGAADAINNATDLVLGALERMDIDPSSRPFWVADYAAADGGTSLQLITQVVAAVRERAPKRPIGICYTDLPSNDYSSLFRRLHQPAPSARSYCLEFDDIFPFASATSFYESILPAGELDFGFSATAMHWLSEMPCELTEHFHAVGATGAERALLKQRAAADWERILLQRAREMRPGARFVGVNLALDDAGRHMGNTGGRNMFDEMNALWRGMVDDRRITEAEFRRLCVPQFYRTLDEFRAPFQDPQSPVYQVGLRLESAEIRYVECPYAARFAREGDVEWFANAYVPTTRTWSESALVNSLSDTRPLAERQALVAEFFDAFVEAVRRDPGGHGMSYVHAYLVMKKI